MAWIQRLLTRFRSSFAHSRHDQELDAEIASHLDFAIEENIKRGMSAEGARRQALIKFGGVEQAKQQHREARGLPALEILFQDLRYEGLQPLKGKIVSDVRAKLWLLMQIHGCGKWPEPGMDAVSLPSSWRVRCLVSLLLLPQRGC